MVVIQNHGRGRDKPAGEETWKITGSNHNASRHGLLTLGAYLLAPGVARRSGRPCRPARGRREPGRADHERGVQAALDHNVSLTEHAVAVERARSPVAQINSFVESLRGSGRLKTFNQLYRAQREAAAAQGRGFVSYSVAMARLRPQIGARLAAGGDLHSPGMLQEVFR
jgi:hypothetical protein